jgi:hypothetical protein
MLGTLSLWTQRRKLRSSIPRDPLTTFDPAPWLDGAGSVMHLRASCPQPSWLVHCAYWAGVKQDLLLDAAIAAGLHVAQRGHADLLPELQSRTLRRVPYPELAEMIFAIERKHPAIKAIEAYFPSGGNFLLSSHLGDRRPRKLDAGTLTASAAVAAGYVLLLVSVFHRERGLREALALTCGGAATMFSIGMPGEARALLDLQRKTYGWESSMTATAFVK